MKKIINTNIALLVILMVGLSFAITSCEDSDGSPEVKAGNPVLESVTPEEAQGGALVVIKGTGLGDMRSVVFEKESVPAYLMSTLNTENSILFRIPPDAVGGPQNIILTNSDGVTLEVPFNVLAFPQLVSVSNYNFVAGTEITITGKNLDDVLSVTLNGTTDVATIVSKEKTKLVIAMPATAAFRTTLDVVNVTGLTTSTFEMVSITNNFVMYTDAYGPGAFNGGIQSWSYGVNGVSETDKEVKSGTKSLKVDYQANGGLSLFLGSDTWGAGHWFTDYFTPAYLTFWAKGEGFDVNIRLVNDSPPWDGTVFPSGTLIVTVPKDVWTYFKIPASTWPGSFGRFNIVNTETAGRVVYYDDLMFIK